MINTAANSTPGQQKRSFVKKTLQRALSGTLEQSKRIQVASLRAESVATHVAFTTEARGERDRERITEEEGKKNLS